MADQGRPTLCTPEMIEQVEALASYGMPVRRICDLLGISHTAHYDWLKRASAGDEPFVAYSAAYARGEALCIQTRLMRIDAAAEAGDARNDQWLLEHRFPRDFALTSKVALGGDPDAPAVKHEVGGAVDELIARLDRLAAGILPEGDPGQSSQEHGTGASS